MQYTNHNFGHDEYDYASNYFKRWLWSKKPDMYWRMPTAFGPFPGPRQDVWGRRQPAPLERTFSTMSVKFRTSRTFLESLFPSESFRFKAASTVCQASFSVTTLNKMSWLGGEGYNHFGLYIHGVQYHKKDDTTLDGTYLPVLFENLGDPIVSDREEVGMPKLFCDIDVQRQGKSSSMKASWRGATFAEISITDLNEDDAASERGTIGGDDSDGLLVYRYVPAVGQPGKADAEYAVHVSHREEETEVLPTVNTVWRSPNASIKMTAQDWKVLPTLHHITSVLAEIPVYGVVSAKIVEGIGVSSVFSAKRIE
jgi:Acetoacetate decarboxylase (ADC)